MHEIPWSSTFSHEILLPHQVGKQIMFRSAPLFQARLQLSFFQNRESWARSPTESWGEFRGHRNMVNYFIHSFPIYICLVVWNIGTWILFFHIYIYIYILGISSSQLTCIFFRGVEPTNQLGYKWAIFNCHAGVSIKWGYPKWMVYFLESPVKMDENWGYPHFRKPPCFMKLGRYLVAHPRNLKWIITPVISGFSCRVDPLKKLGWTNPLTIRG